MKKQPYMKFVFSAVFLVGVAALIVSCAHFPGTQKPSLKTEPTAVDMNPRAMAGMKIIGSGFKAGDRIEIALIGADKGKDVPVAFAEADEKGAFETKMNMLSILQGIFHFKFTRGKPAPNPKNPPLSPGLYVMQASSWDSKLKATCSLEIKMPPKKKK